MKNIFEHIEHLKGKPHHIRKRVAFATATGVTAVIALVWLVGSVSSGVFAIQGSTFAESTGEQPIVTTGTAGGNSGLAGAAAALPDAGANAPAHIEIIDAATATPAKPPQTVIPF